MTKKQNIINKLSNIQESLDILFQEEIENFLEDVSFSYDYIQLACEDTRLDKYLQYAISKANNEGIVYDCLQSMIDLLS